MRFYTQQHGHYCGIDLHARTMYVCIISQDGTVLVEENIRARPGPFLELIAPYRDDLVVAVECIFTWYWLADLCDEEGIPFASALTRNDPGLLTKKEPLCFGRRLPPRVDCNTAENIP